ncbi:oligoribonuclease [Arcanobacterium hippocoleae]|uniref:Oligoribonuclease n=1 Tax=Arcanobacterium hippocoleae TaxID=149017 RepID=A0ABU1T1K9_9ACTO|nr:oligoribonuclease [Arcanobacterium hippocoleae]MDR6939176.1 oligoribonuclease [Arcanobacterium hippocoleae]
MNNFTAQNSPIVWIDCEMTGLDLERDELCEIAVVVTDSELNPYDTGLDLVIRPGAAAVAQMNPFVRKMHTKTNLIHEWDEGLSVAQAQAQVLEYIKRFVPEAGKAHLGGNSVGTDKNFLLKQMPELVDYLHYRIIDVSSIKELVKRWYPRVYFAAPEKTGGHRALGDIYDSIDELRYYRGVLMPDGEGPSSAEAKDVAEEILADLTAKRAAAAHTRLSQ